VDRVYIERFLRTHSALIRGRVMEVKSGEYAENYGGDRVSAIDVLDIDPSNPLATVVADLGQADSLPRDQFDTILLNQTLQLVPDHAAAIRNCWAALAPGGTLLLTVPTVSTVIERINDLWRWTPLGLEIDLAKQLPAGSFRVEGHGCLPATIAFLHGLSAEEVGRRYLDPFDPEYPLIVSAVVTKPR
jgi:SAM-dependent methyltransferase